jgi:DNA-binding NarL/FixJ family response regulator
MPIMDGFQTVRWLSTNYTDLKVLAFDTRDDKQTILGIIKGGAKGSVIKDG